MIVLGIAEDTHQRAAIFRERRGTIGAESSQLRPLRARNPMDDMREQERKPVVLSPTDFAQEVTREILRQNAEILRTMLNPMIYVPPENRPPIFGAASRAEASLGSNDDG